LFTDCTEPIRSFQEGWLFHVVCWLMSLVMCRSSQGVWLATHVCAYFQPCLTWKFAELTTVPDSGAVSNLNSERSTEPLPLSGDTPTLATP
jgi:hypothetical protein